MGEARRRREAGFSGEKRKPEKGLRGRKALRAQATVQELPKPKDAMTVDGQKYFRDPVTGSLRKVGPKLVSLLRRRHEGEKKQVEEEYKRKLEKSPLHAEPYE